MHISDPFVLQILPTFVSARRLEVGSRGQLFPVHYETLRKTFHHALQWLHLDTQGFTQHSHRHGDAMHDALHGKQVADIIRSRRWSDPRSATSYLQTGRALLLSFTIRSSTARCLAVSEVAIRRLLQSGGVADELPWA